METSKEVQEKFKGYCVFLLETMDGYTDECQNPFDLAVLGNVAEAIPRAWVKMIVDLLKKYGHIIPCTNEVDQYKISEPCRKAIETKDWRILDTMVLEFAEPYINREKAISELSLIKMNLKFLPWIFGVSIIGLIVSIISIIIAYNAGS